MTQLSISDEQLEYLAIGRRQLSTEWPETIKAKAEGDNFCPLLPFPETFQNAFVSMYGGNYHPRRTQGGLLQIFLNGTEYEDEPPEELQSWIEIVGRYVAIKDFLAISFALDYTCEGGNPAKPKSAIAEMRLHAKPYQGIATTAHEKAAQKLAQECVAFLEIMSCYNQADCVVAIPPSDPNKGFSLPKVLAASIAKAKGIKNFSNFVSTKAKRESIKNVEIGKKLSTIQGSIDIEGEVFDGRTILLVDDLYQSGNTMNYCAQLLLDAGADYVFGLACEKTCRNDDNV